MKKPLQIVIWMNMPSHHQDDFLCSLAQRAEVELEVIFARQLSTARREQGWTAGSGNFRHRTLAGFFDAVCTAWKWRDRVHVVNGIWAEPLFATVLALMACCGAKYAIHAEQPDPFVKRSRLKRWARSAFGRSIARRASGLFSVSRASAEAFVPLGVDAAKVFPFGYFHSRVTLGTPSVVPPSTEFLFVGRLIELKNLPTLLRAFSLLRQEGQEATLRVVGGGEQEGTLRRMCDELGVTSYVRFEGRVPAIEVARFMPLASALVLPSRYEGWGVVVNEALMSGVPVIVSSACGSSELIEDGKNGFVFQWNDAVSLKECMVHLIKADQARMRAAAFEAGGRITADAVMPYFVQCLETIAAGQGRSGDCVPPWQLARQCSAGSVG